MGVVLTKGTLAFQGDIGVTRSLPSYSAWLLAEACTCVANHACISSWIGHSEKSSLKIRLESPMTLPLFLHFIDLFGFVRICSKLLPRNQLCEPLVINQ